jgi:hypothetical protein
MNTLNQKIESLISTLENDVFLEIEQHFIHSNLDISNSSLEPLTNRFKSRIKDSIDFYTTELKKLDSNIQSSLMQPNLRKYTNEINKIFSLKIENLEKEYINSLKDEFSKSKVQTKLKTLDSISKLTPIAKNKLSLMLEREKQKYRDLYLELKSENNKKFEETIEVLSKDIKAKFEFEKSKIAHEWQKKLFKMKSHLKAELLDFEKSYRKEKLDYYDSELKRLEANLIKKEEKIRQHLLQETIEKIDSFSKDIYIGQKATLIANHKIKIAHTKELTGTINNEIHTRKLQHNRENLIDANAPSKVEFFSADPIKENAINLPKALMGRWNKMNIRGISTLSGKNQTTTKASHSATSPEFDEYTKSSKGKLEKYLNKKLSDA